MPPKPGLSIFGTDGSSHRLSREIGRGGEGSVWALDGQSKLVAKFYHGSVSASHAKKLEAMCRLKTEALSNVSAWPIALVSETKAGKPQGLLMPQIVEHQSVNQLYGIKSRLRSFPEAQFPFLLHVAMNAARAFATIHNSGQVIGDVNHSNLMISQTATVAMIDCDSFQIREGQNLFFCPVGVPEFTPPELQGVNFGSHARTQQHDLFGLAVLVFYMLFLGRHPFMGVYDSKAGDIMSLEQAIAAYKFPYTLGANSPEVRLPPFGPHLADYPIGIAQLFRRAFTRESPGVGRPSAEEWVSGLASLASSLKTCKSNPNHHYFSGLNSCPWCKVEGSIGMPIFGIKFSVIHESGFNIAVIWAQITAISPVVEELTLPDLKTLRAKHSPDTTIPAIVHRRRYHRICSISIVVVFSFLAAEFLPMLFALLIIGAALFTGHRIWQKGKALADGFRERHRDAEAAYSTAMSEFEKMRFSPEQFKKAKEQLESTKRDYEGLPKEKAKKLALLNSNREQKQRQHFLEKFRIEDERIPNIGPKNKAILYTWGILDAWDINSAAITQIKGFGPVKRDSLLAWRAEKERSFRFNPSVPIDPRDIHALEHEFSKRSQDLQKVLNAGPNNLRQIVSVWRAQRSQMANRVWGAADMLAKSQVDRSALRQF